jgi:hypothetical protein
VQARSNPGSRDHKLGGPVGDPVSVYVVVTLEYMVGEVLELADSTAKAQEQDGITAILRIYHDMMQSCFCALIALSASSSGLATVYSNVAARLTAAPV